MKKKIKILLSGIAVLTLVVVVFIMNNSEEKTFKEHIKFNMINIDLSKLIEEKYMFSTDFSDISDVFEVEESEVNKMFDESNSKLINL